VIVLTNADGAQPDRMAQDVARISLGARKR
jgi:hypothetical protein